MLVIDENIVIISFEIADIGIFFVIFGEPNFLLDKNFGDPEVMFFNFSTHAFF